MNEGEFRSLHFSLCTLRDELEAPAERDNVPSLPYAMMAELLHQQLEGMIFALSHARTLLDWEARKQKEAPGS